ncbi:MAG: hypothetical protein HN515_07580 [Candidatus Marinimicrobia bacterium]|nr:hypothetical protein [Candidatus Neomarinimicrobiota bacterium]
MIGIGNVYNKAGNFLQAKEKYYSAFEIFKKNKSLSGINGQAVALNCLSRTEKFLINYDNAVALSKEALDTRRSSLEYREFLKSMPGYKNSHLGSAISVAYQHGVLAGLYIDLEIYDMALEQLQASDSLIHLVLSNQLTDQENLLINAKQYLGNNHTKRMVVLYNLKNFVGAHVESKLAYKYIKENPIQLVRHYLDKIDLYMKQDSLYAGLEMIDEALKLCKLNGLEKHEIEFLEKKMNILKSNNLEKSALKVSNSLLEKKKNMSDDQSKMLLENLHYKTELDNNQLKLKKAKSRELIIFIISGSAMILLGLIIINYRNRRKTGIRETLIHKQKKQLAENELKTKEAELMQMSTFIVEKNELLNTINTDLKYHQNLLNNNADKKSLEPLRQKLKSEINEKADWAKFQKHLFSIHPNFIKTLNTEYPNLSTGEIKLCCYLKMNQTTKDIAQWTSLSVRAVENKRYRLRKKLALKKATRLDVFIHGLDIQTV